MKLEYCVALKYICCCKSVQNDHGKVVVGQYQNNVNFQTETAQQATIVRTRIDSVQPRTIVYMNMVGGAASAVAILKLIEVHSTSLGKVCVSIE